MTKRKFGQAALGLALLSMGALIASDYAAYAGAGTIVVLDGNGVARTYALTTDGSTNFMPRNTIWDYAAGANGAGVNASHEQLVTASQSGTWNAVVTNAGTFATQATQAGAWNITNVTGTVSLPTGAATAAKQPALGTAGTASTDVLSVQGIAAMTPFLVTAQASSAVIGHVICDSGCSGSGGTSQNDNSAFTEGTTAFNAIGGEYNTAPGNATSGRVGVVQMTIDRMLYTNVGKINGVAPSMGNGASGTGVQRVTIANDSTGIIALTTSSAVIGHVICDSGCSGSGGTSSNYGSAFPAAGTAIGITNGTNMVAPVQVSNGANIAATGILASGLLAQCDDTSPQAITENSWGNLRLDCTTHSLRVLSVDVNGTAADFTGNTSTNTKAINGTTILTGGVAGSQGVGGLAANNATASGNPVPVSALATSAEATLATNGQNSEFVTDLAHKQIVLPYANPENFVSGVTAAMTGTTTTSIIASPGGSLRNYVTQIICTNSHATVGTFVVVQDGSGGTTIYEGYAAAVGGGFSISFPTPLRQPTTATAIFVADVTTGANVICSASGYKGV